MFGLNKEKDLYIASCAEYLSISSAELYLQNAECTKCDRHLLHPALQPFNHSQNLKTCSQSDTLLPGKCHF